MSTALSKISPEDARRTNERYTRWEGIIPLPPDGLMWSVGGLTLEIFLVMSDAWGQLLMRLTETEASVLDIGCGCARAARVLLPSPRIKSYVGFDVIPQSIDWCNRFLTPLFPQRARFLHFDVYSAEYNPSGSMLASDLVFPCADKSVDLVVAASLFTHLLEPDAIHYLNEVGRVLSKRGRAALSIHTEIAPGVRFSGNEGRIDIDPKYFSELARRAHLVPLETIPDLGGQLVIVFGRA
jgi:SAM-dependent methyltransferase